ncbi:MAG: class I SAM-dependent methyltransferase [Gammaproteobacteria bacterium]
MTFLIATQTYGASSNNTDNTDQTKFGIRADQTELVNKLYKAEIPEKEEDGTIKTLNKMGFMNQILDPFSQDFIDFSAKANGPVLDGGAAYGIATIEALKKGATVIANDLDSGHLYWIAKNPTLKASDLKRLYLNQSKIPDDLKLPKESLNAILLSRVIHFFTPVELRACLEQAKGLLKPGGRLYITTMTPYHYALKGFDLTYETRKKSGDEWPGIITTMTKDYIPKNKGKIPEFLHVMDPEVLIRELSRAGFVVKKMELFGFHRNKDVTSDNGRGYIGIIAEKI